MDADATDGCDCSCETGYSAEDCSVEAKIESIQGTMVFSVEAGDVTTFLSDPKVKTALKKTIAENIDNVEPDMVEITDIKLAGDRRLHSEARRLASSVEVDYKVTLPRGQSAAAAETQLKEVGADALKASLTTALAEEDLTLEFAVDSVEVVVSTSEASEGGSTTRKVSLGNATYADSAWRVSISALFGRTLFWLLV
jgi:hypothetical protein